MSQKHACIDTRPQICPKSWKYECRCQKQKAPCLSLQNRARWLIKFYFQLQSWQRLRKRDNRDKTITAFCFVINPAYLSFTVVSKLTLSQAVARLLQFTAFKWAIILFFLSLIILKVEGYPLSSFCKNSKKKNPWFFQSYWVIVLNNDFSTDQNNWDYDFLFHNRAALLQNMQHHHLKLHYPFKKAKCELIVK